MNPFNEAGLYLLQTLGHLYLFILLLRFISQASRADFNNPVSRFLIRATHKPTIPIRKVFPTYRTFDMATLVLAFVFQCLVIQLSALLVGYPLIPFMYLIAWAVIGMISLVLYIYLYGLLIVIIVSWVAPHSYHPVLILLQQLMEPVTKPIRKIIPAMGGLDLSPIFIFLIINMLRIFLTSAAAAMQVRPILIPGI